eukprot:jgi/Ulvmu1/12338/UM089_0022.1
MVAVDWGSIPTDILNSVSERCSSKSVTALRGVSRHWSHATSSATRCRCSIPAQQRPIICHLPPLHDISRLEVIELFGVDVLGTYIEVLLSSKVLKALAVRECLVDDTAIDHVFEARGLHHLSLSSSRIITRSASSAALPRAEANIAGLGCSVDSVHDADGDVVMRDEEFAACTCHQRPESALRSLDLSGVEGLPDNRAASALSACSQLVALRVAVSAAHPATLAALANLPLLAHLEISAATSQRPSPQPCDLPAALSHVCNAIAERSDAQGLAQGPPPPNEAIRRLPQEAPWWASHAQSSSQRQPAATATTLHASLQPQCPFHLVVDFPIITSNPRGWLTEAYASIPFRALTLRQAQPTEPRVAVQLSAAHGIPCSHSVPALAGPATLAAQATPDAARALHALLPDLLMGNAPLSHFQLLGVEVTEAVIRHMRMVHAPLQSLCLHNSDPEATARPPPSPERSPRSSLDASDEHAAEKLDSAASSTPTAPELRARMAARWRRPASATLRQLIDTQATARLLQLELVDLPGVNDTVLRRIRSQASALQHLTVSGTCSVSLDGIYELRWMKLLSLHLSHLSDPCIASHGLQALACGVNGLASSLTDLSFEGYEMPLAAFADLRLFVKLRHLSLDDSEVLPPVESMQCGLEATAGAAEAQLLDAARYLLENASLSSISARGTALGDFLGHARGELQVACRIDTVPF